MGEIVLYVMAMMTGFAVAVMNDREIDSRILNKATVYCVGNGGVSKIGIGYSIVTVHCSNKATFKLDVTGVEKE